MKYRDIKGVMQARTGLFLYDPPTGKGKSYAARELLYQNAKRGTDKQIFITNNIKNLSTNEIKAFYKKDDREAEFANEVLHIKANVDFLLSNLTTLTDYPEEYKTELYKKTFKAVLEYHGEEGERKRELKQIIREDLEPQFRSELKKMIGNNLPRQLEERQRIINEDKNWQWLSKLYPTAKIWNYKIFFLTVKKFIQVIDPIIDKNFVFLNSYLTEGATIVIDEFDETKEVILEDIIDYALSSRFELFKIFRRVYHALTNPRHEKILKKYDDKLKRSFLEKRGENFPGLILEAKELYDKYRIDLTYRTDDATVNTNRVVLFDGENHFSYDDKKIYTSAVVNTAEDRVDLSFVSKEKYEATVLEKRQLRPIEMITELYYFIEKFKAAVEQWAYQLRTETNNMRGINDSRMTRHQSITSLFNHFEFSPDEIEKLVNRKMGPVQLRRNIKDETKIQLQWYEYVDSDNNFFDTMIQMMRIEDIPESTIITLAKRARVIGLSATALVPTVIGNYDLRRIQSQLGKDYHVATEDETLLSHQTKNDYQKAHTLYKENQIAFKTYAFDQFYDLSFTDKKLSEIIYHYQNENCSETPEHLARETKVAIDNLMDRIDQENITFYQNRYLELLESFCIFLTSPKQQSLLALQNTLPKIKKAEFEAEFIQKTFKKLANYYQVKADIFILKSESYEERKQELMQRLSSGEKIYILTSYATTGAGQNLQYAFGEEIETVCLQSDLSEEMKSMLKDIDGIYLGNITYLLSYLQKNIADEALNRQILKFLLEIEYIFGNGEISREYKNNLVGDILKIYATRQYQPLKTGVLAKTPSVRLKATKLVIQAVGRITRTENKTKNITVLISPTLLDTITSEGLNLEMLTPEMRAILNLKQKEQNKVNPQVIARRRRNNFHLKNSRLYVDRLLANIHTSEKARADWRNLRLALLQAPTCKFLPTDGLADAYIEAPDGFNNQYFYAVDEWETYYFGTSKSDLKRQFKGEIPTIYEVSQENVRLQTLLKYPGLKEYFIENNFKTEFEMNPYIVNPKIYQAILKGAYGEVAGRFIVEQELDISLFEIKTASAFELFDFYDKQNNYYDFKNWHEMTKVPAEKMYAKIRQKLKDVGGQKAWLLNLFKPDKEVAFRIMPAIIEIPWLLDDKGNSALKEWYPKIRREENET